MLNILDNNLSALSTNPTNIYGVRNAIEMTAMKYLNFNDPIINYVVTIIVLSFIGTLMVKIEKIPEMIINVINRIYSLIHNIIFNIYYKLKKQKLKKLVIIEKITDDRQVNPLYHALSWYLMNQVNLDEEESIKCSIESKICENSEKKPDLFRRVMQDSVRKLTFDNKDIYYKLSASRIKIDGEDHDRRNDSIECWTFIYKKNDVFLESFINFCLEKYLLYTKNKNSKRYIYQNINGSWSVVTSQEDRIEDTIVLKNDDKEKLFEEIDHFISNKDWYINHGFLYSLGILLYGNPGTGKTSLIRYISNMTQRNTHYLRLGQIQSETEFNKLLKEIKLNETILVMEDIDCAGKIVHNRDKIYEDDINKKDYKGVITNELDINSLKKLSSGNIKIVLDNNNNNNNKSNKDLLNEKDKVTLDILLNILDGILTTSGQIIIMTTNHKEILDKALIRPGRVDIFLELSKCNHQMISKLCKNFYDILELSPEHEKILKSIPESEYSPAYVMNIFRKYKNDSLQGLINIHNI